MSREKFINWSIFTYISIVGLSERSINSMEKVKQKKTREVLTMQEYLNRRKNNRKKEEEKWKLLTKIEWNFMIQK